MAGKNRIRGFSKKKKRKDNMVFSPSPHWLLCEEPSFDINWVKHEGGREGGQQLDPTVNVTLVSQLHRCQSLSFQFIFFTFYPCTPLLISVSEEAAARMNQSCSLTSSMCLYRQTTHACWQQTDELLKLHKMHPPKNVHKHLNYVVLDHLHCWC